MQRKKTLFLFYTGVMSLICIGLWLLIPQPADAQCGSQASSCKNCHEVQKQAPVNNDGSHWHQSHAFGDFCVFCHAGNQQATTKDAAHVGMVAPLSDVKASCQQCHSTDLVSRAQVYATILNVKLDSSGNQISTAASTANAVSGGALVSTAAPTVSASVVSAAASNSGSTAAQSVVQPTAQPIAQSTVSAPTTNEMVVNDPNTVDYVERYNEIVLGQRPVNTGNIVLLALIGLVVVFGGGFVLFNEIRLSNAANVTQKVEGDYPEEVVEMLPALASLNRQSRELLKNILKQPKKTDKVLGVIDSLVSDETTKE